MWTGSAAYSTYGWRGCQWCMKGKQEETLRLQRPLRNAERLTTDRAALENALATPTCQVQPRCPGNQGSCQRNKGVRARGWGISVSENKYCDKATTTVSLLARHAHLLGKRLNKTRPLWIWLEIASVEVKGRLFRLIHLTFLSFLIQEADMWASKQRPEKRSRST